MSMNVTPVTGTATDIANALLTEIVGSTAGLSNINAAVTGNPDSFGKFTGDPFGLNGGIVLSNGFAAQAVGPNNFENLSGNFNGDPDTNGGVFDEAVLTITFDSASATKAFFSYVFASDEFVEFGGTEFNDKFELLINGVNAARLNNGDEISVNTLVPDAANPATWSPDFIDNTGGKASQETEFDGYTKFLNFKADINAGSNTIVIRVKDVGDNDYDSAVFIKKGSFGTTEPVVPTPPPAPTGLDLLTDTPTATDASTLDNRTYEATPDFSGQGSKAGNIIKLYSDFEGFIGQTTIASDHTWTIANASVGGQDLLVGDHKIYAIEYDADSGLASPQSALSIYIDSTDRDTDVTAPDAPVNLDLVTASDTVNSFGAQSSSDNDTDDRTPTISGEAEANSIVTLYSNKDGAIGSVRVGRNGKWSITASLLQSGDHILTTEARDWANNLSGRSAGLNIFVRNLPSVPDLTDTSDTGVSKSDNITFDSTPTFTGVAEAGSTVELFVDGASATTVTTDGQGQWSFTSATLAEGSHTIKAKATNRQTGTYDDFSSELGFTIDTTPPASAPSTPDLTDATDNGVSNSDNISSVKSPSFSGTAEPNSFVTITSSLDGVLGKVKVGADGKWTINVSKRKKLRSGNHQITAQAVDVAGNASLISAPLSITSLPDVSAPDLVAANDSGVSNSDNYTNDTTPTFTGTSELGSTVTLFYLDSGGNRVDIGSVVVSTDDGEGGGQWEITTNTLPEGDYDIKAEAQKSGFTNVSDLLHVTIDTDGGGTIKTPAPGSLDLTTATDSGTNSADNITTNNRPTFTGTGIDGNTIELLDGVAKIGTAIVSNGVWNITPTADLALGSHDISAQQIDKAGNPSDPTPVLSAPNNVTIVPSPQANNLGLIAANDSGASNTDDVTRDNAPTLTGTASIGSTIDIFDGATKIGSAPVDNSGNWGFTAPTLADGNHAITARVIDTYGNVGNASAPLNLVIDTIAPSQPGLPDLTAATDTGSSNTDNLTGNAQPTFTGATEANSQVEVFVDNVSQGLTTVGGSSWSYTPNANLTQGSHDIKVKIIDLAGNTSVLSNPLNFEIDTIAPAQPSMPDLIDASDTGASNTDNITGDDQPQFTGIAEAGSQIALFSDRDGAIGTATVGSDGKWTLKAKTLRKGSHKITSQAIDKAGNVSLASNALDLQILTVDLSIDKTSFAEGDKAVLTATLAAVSAQDVTVNLAVSGTVSSDDYTLPTSIVILAGQLKGTVELNGVDDFVAEGSESLLVDILSVGNAVENGTQQVRATLTDNDVAGITIAPLNLTTTEAGATATFTVALDSKPTSNVTVNLVSSKPTEGSVPASVVFTPQNWNQVQNVTVTGVDDAVVDGDMPYLIQTSVSSSDASYAAIDPADVTLTNSDNDSPGVLLTQSNGSTSVTEGGKTDSYTLVLTSQPTANVTISIAPDQQTTVNNSTVTFTPQNWNQAQTVTVTAVDDALSEGSHSSTITHTVSSTDSIYSGAIVKPITVAVGDNDSAGVQVTPIRLTTGEDGTAGSFGVALTSQPIADVVLRFASSNPQEGMPQQSSLTFTAANWNQVQVVTVNGVNDPQADGDQAYSIATTISSNDTHYNGLSVSAINLTNVDNDRARVTLNPTQGLVTTEAGGTATFRVVLTSQPTADVAINLSSSNSAEGKVANSITFSTANWYLPQTVTVTGVDDSLVDGDIGYTIRTSIASTDAVYAAIDPADVSLINRDNEINAAPTSANVSDRLASSQVLNLKGITATDPDGSVATIAINSLPDASQGVLYLGNPSSGGVSIKAGQNLPSNDATNLFFQASAHFEGVHFTYTAIDNLGKVSLPAVITLEPLAADSPLAANSDDDSDDDCCCDDGEGIVRKGKGGKDKLSFTPERDRLSGMGGNDRLHGGDGRDTIRGNKGNDRLFGDGCNDLLSGGLGKDRLSGGTGRDTLQGGRGNDKLHGDTGNDVLSGGTGNDRVFGDQGNDLLGGGRGNDRLKGGTGNDVLSGNAGRDRLMGGSGNDQIGGGRGDDLLRGGRGSDRLKGGAGNDILVGGAGDDLLSGGRGRDRFVCGKAGKMQGDRITDFEVGRDVLDLHGLNKRVAASDRKAVVKLVQIGSNTQVKVDLNGKMAGGLETIATLDNVAASSLNARSFLF